MDSTEALNLIENLVYWQTGKHLNDLERKIFLGSWDNHTYEQIHPLNPDYVEKDVGYKLWKKISNLLGEKVTKKKFRRAIERAIKRVLILYRDQEPDRSLAATLYQKIADTGHRVFSTDVDFSNCNRNFSGEDWFSQIESQLKQCDYLIIILSTQAAVSEILIETLQRAKNLSASRLRYQPQILAIQIQDSTYNDSLLNHCLVNYLQHTPKIKWQPQTDANIVVEEVLSYLLGKKQAIAPSVLEYSPVETAISPQINQIPPPLPVAEPELPNGRVPLDSAFYIERIPWERRCYQGILQPGNLIRIKAPRQMGKTSLMARTLAFAQQQGYRSVPLNFQYADAGVFSSLNTLLRWFCHHITRKLHLDYSLEDSWYNTFGSKDNCTAYFEDYLLSTVEQPLVLGLDEVDRVFKYPAIADDFFGLLRAWYEEAGYGCGDSNLWAKLRLVVVHSTEVYVPLDINQSPFNVGLPIELREFTPEQVLDLAQRHALNWQQTQVEQLMQIIGGHPYLVRLALYHLAQKQLNLGELLDTAPTEAGIYGDHLRRHTWSFRQHSELASAFAEVVNANQPVELESALAFKLHSMGLVHLQGNQVTPRFELYRQYFYHRLKNCP